HWIGKRRTRRKLHFCADEATLEIISVVASTNDLGDAEALPDLLEDAPGEIEQASADGAYDQRRCYATLNCHRTRAAMRAPQRGQDLEPRQRQIGTPHPRRKPVADQESRAQAVGAGERLSSSEPGGDSGIRFKTIFGDWLQTRQID